MNNNTLSGGALAAVIIIGIFAPWIAPYSPIEQDLSQLLLPPDAAHWMGTDDLGRDVLSRLIWGAPNSLYASSLAVRQVPRAGRLSWQLTIFLVSIPVMIARTAANTVTAPMATRRHGLGSRGGRAKVITKCREATELLTQTAWTADFAGRY